MNIKHVSLLAAVALAGLASPVVAQTMVALGAAGSFGVLAGTSITNSGVTVVNGDLGVSPGATVTETPAITVNGIRHVNDSIASDAQAALTAAYNNAAGQTPTVSLGAAFDLGSSTRTAGVYNSTGSLAITGILTLDAQSNPNAVWIFQAGSTLTTANSSQVQFINGGSAANVFWQVGSSATFNDTSQFVGNVLALTSITLNNGAIVDGRLLARNGAVILTSNTVSVPTAIPESSTYALVAGLLTLGLVAVRRRSPGAAVRA
ncbi:MAG: ice-binding family protein [Lacunisphaera sp.]|nr:ice-binding family protein [Lacunisphaera sp.]